jgi:hypothetical protein
MTNVANCNTNQAEYYTAIRNKREKRADNALACGANTLSKWIDCQLLSSDDGNQLSSNGGGHFTPLVCSFGVKLKVVIDL